MSDLLDVYTFKDLSDGTCLVYSHKQELDNILDDDIDIQSVTGILSFSSRDEANEYILKKAIIDTAL